MFGKLDFTMNLLSGERECIYQLALFEVLRLQIGQT
jgi:hypothetical protein